ncbi:MAG: CHAT domain-containing protein [Bacteroidales bacterium]|nr:CHAT domain-containing protein [Bacteroidales bacterium]
MSAPVTVKLQLKATDPATYYTTPALYNQIWQPMQKYLQGITNVYFAPSGQLHSIAIEYLPDDKGEIFAKKYNTYRLTSTRELAIARTANHDNKAAVYGGIIYDFSKGDWQDLKDYKDEIEAEFRDIPDFEDEGAQRAGITFLKGAKVEAEEVTDILRDGSYLVSDGSDIYATEESFKKLSGTGVKLMHIATHGFYEPANKAKSFSDFLTTGNQNNKEDLSLSRSGLFLAGAASALDPIKRKDIPDGVEDGILTAKEISRLDFSGLDLVVLSACQTGLGEITDEGVFGLQRGFKKAGAQTIVMSLWKVDDAATKDLMTAFYKYMTSGMSKREAFVTALKELRKQYSDPQKWAAFIMVDAL